MIWKCTSRMFPEQYDIYKSTGPAVAYFRLRHGDLYVHPYKHGEIDWNTDIYIKHYEDESGFFDHDDWKEEKEFQKIKKKIEFKIHWYLFKQWIKSIFI